MACRLASRRLAALAAGATGLALCAGTVASGAALATPVPGWKIQTVAGGPGGPGPAATLRIGACALTFASGHLFLADGGGLVRAISLRTGWLTTVAGTTGLVSPASGIVPPTPAGTPATQASLGYDCGVAVDRRGNVLVSDGETFGDGSPGYGNNMVRVVAARTGTYYGQAMKAGAIYTIAGNGTNGFSGDGGQATSAELDGPAGLAVGAAASVLVADTGNDRIRVIAGTTGTFYGQAMTAGDIYTIAGTGPGDNPVGNGGPATSAQLGIEPQPAGEYTGTEPQAVLTTDRHGNIVLADPYFGEVRVVAASTGEFYGQQMRAGYIYQVGGSSSGQFSSPSDVAVDSAGNIVVADTGHYKVKVIAARSGRFYGQPMTAGHTYTIAGGGKGGYGGPAKSARLDNPVAVTVDSAGNVVIANGGAEVVPVRSGHYYGRAMKAGDIYAIAGYGPRWPARGVLSARAQFTPADMASDSHGNAIIADGNRILAAALVSGRFYGLAMKAGRVYSVAGGGTQAPADGRQAAKVRLLASLVAVDRYGNLLTAHIPTCGCANGRISVVAERTGWFYGQPMKTGHVYAVAGTGKIGRRGDGGPATRAAIMPYAITSAPHGNIVFADNRSTIRVVAEASGRYYGRWMKARDIYTIAGGGLSNGVGGGLATSYQLAPYCVHADRTGNILFCNGYEVDVVAAVSGTFYGRRMKAGHLYTIAGTGYPGASGYGGPATKASVSPAGLALDAAGNVIITDWGIRAGGQVLVVAERTATFYGQHMTSGDIYAIAGGGTTGLGDGGPALDAEIILPDAVAVLRSGAILVADDSRIRLISP